MTDVNNKLNEYNENEILIFIMFLIKTNQIDISIFLLIIGVYFVCI